MQNLSPVRRRPIGEYMAEVGVSMFAPDLDPRGKEAMVLSFHDISRLQRLGEAGPPGSRFKLVQGAEQRFPETMST